jgi:hypothetical protein
MIKEIGKTIKILLLVVPKLVLTIILVFGMIIVETVLRIHETWSGKSPRIPGGVSVRSAAELKDVLAEIAAKQDAERDVH